MTRARALWTAAPRKAAEAAFSGTTATSQFRLVTCWLRACGVQIQEHDSAQDVPSDVPSSQRNAGSGRRSRRDASFVHVSFCCPKMAVADTTRCPRQYVRSPAVFRSCIISVRAGDAVHCTNLTCNDQIPQTSTAAASDRLPRSWSLQSGAPQDRFDISRALPSASS